MKKQGLKNSQILNHKIMIAQILHLNVINLSGKIITNWG
jgi:hypothetical protein